MHPRPDEEAWDRFHVGAGLTPIWFGSDVVREGGRLAKVDVGYEYRRFCEIRDGLLLRYCTGLRVHEFGCGTGHNIIGLRERVGYERSGAAVARMRARGIEAHHFDMTKPWEAPVRGEAVLTVHAMEQLGQQFAPFLDFVCGSMPAVVVQIEPIIEWYDQSVLLDWLAVRYHEKRGYLGRYWTELKSRNVTILEEKRTYFGNLFHEAYSILVWKPC